MTGVAVRALELVVDLPAARVAAALDDGSAGALRCLREQEKRARDVGRTLFAEMR